MARACRSVSTTFMEDSTGYPQLEHSLSVVWTVRFHGDSVPGQDDIGRAGVRITPHRNLADGPLGVGVQTVNKIHSWLR